MNSTKILVGHKKIERFYLILQKQVFIIKGEVTPCNFMPILK